jgi:hypothetical protein
LIPLILFGILFLVIIYIRRRRSAGRKATDTRTNDNMSLPDSVIETSRPVRIENFANHYRLMSADSDFRFSEEFEELKHVGRDQPCTFADLPCNRPKNRFTNILPYDHSRFKLQPVDDEEGSDYVNANYVPVSCTDQGVAPVNNRSLVPGLQLAERVHSDARSSALHPRRLLAHGLGVELQSHHHVDSVRGERTRKVRPLLAVRVDAGLLRRHLRADTERN